MKTKTKAAAGKAAAGKAPSSVVRKKKKTPVAKRLGKRLVSKPAKPRGALRDAKKRPTSSPRKQRKKSSSSPIPADVPSPSVDSVTAAADDTTPSDAVPPPAVVPSPPSKHKWRNRFFIFIFILVLGMLLRTVIFPSAAAAIVETAAADGKKDVLPNVATEPEATGKASWMTWIDVIVMLVSGFTLAWAYMTGGEMWEAEEFRRRFEGKKEREEREVAERMQAEKDATDPASRSSPRDYERYDREEAARRGPAVP